MDTFNVPSVVDVVVWVIVVVVVVWVVGSAVVVVYWLVNTFSKYLFYI